MRVEKEENREALKDMIRAIDESSRAAGQMLDHAMVTLRTDSLIKSQLDLNQSTAELIGRMAPAAELRDIRIEEGALEKIAFFGDPILVQSALRNVLDNAIKFAPAQSVIRLSTSTANGMAIASIEDRGTGFPRAYLDSYVERFTRGENAIGIVGSGLGLTIASDVVKAHGGLLEIKHLEGGGACVSLYFSLG